MTMSEATYPDDLRYHVAHDWAKLDGDVATFGVTWHAQDALGDIVYYAPPEVGTTIHAGDGYGELESVKAVSDVVAPLAGEVVEVNQSVVESPEQVNDDPYGAWLVKVRLSDPASFETLLTADAYRSLLPS
jgi:glycine cleavage system H protein